MRSGAPSPRDCVTASLQDSAPGQLVDVGDRARMRRRRGRPRRARGTAPARVALGHPAEDQVLLVRHAQRAVAVGRAPDRASDAQLRAREVAERHGHGRDGVARLLLRPHVRRAPSARTLVGRQREPRLDRGQDPRAAQLVAAARAADVLERRRPRPRPSRARSRPAASRDRTAAARRPRRGTLGERRARTPRATRPSRARGSGTSAGCAACACSRRARGTRARPPRRRRASRSPAGTRTAGAPDVGQDRRAAADGDAEAAARRPFAATRARQPMSLIAAERVVLGAALERDLELARQRRAQRVAQEVARERLGVRRDVERLVRGDAGVRAGRDVADRVAARLARGEAASASRRIAGSTSWSFTKWNWMFWRVVTWPKPRE